MSDSEAPPSGPPRDMSGVALEQLDTLVRVTTVQAWISLGTLFAVCAGAILFAFLYRVPKKVVGEGILLIKRDRLSQVRALGTGRLVKLGVTLGDKVAPNQVIGEIYQEDLEDTIRETSARLDQLRDENEKLIRFETDERTAQDQAITRLRDAINRTIENSKEGLRVAVRIVEGSERLRLISQLSNLDYLKDLQQKYTIQNDLNNGFSKLAELELTRLTSENVRQRARLQRLARNQQARDEAQARWRKARSHVADRQPHAGNGHPDSHGRRRVRARGSARRPALVAEGDDSRPGLQRPL